MRDKGFLAHEDEEDLPGQNLWDKFIAPQQQVVRQTVQVTDGFLSVRSDSDTNWGKALTFMVVYPAAQQDQGRQWMDALDKQRRESFAATMVVTVPPQTGQAPVADDADKARGFIPFVRHAELDIPCNANPDNAERNVAMKLAAARGERADVQVGLYPLSDVAGVTVTASDLASADGKIPAAAVKVRKVRNFLKRSGSSWMAEIKPFILQNFKTLDLHPGTTRGLWFTVAVPADARPGKYSGNVTIGSGAKTVAIPVELTVHPFILDKVTDITMSVNRHPQLGHVWQRRFRGMVAAGRRRHAGSGRPRHERRHRRPRRHAQGHQERQGRHRLHPDGPLAGAGRQAWPDHARRLLSGPRYQRHSQRLPQGLRSEQ